MQLSLDLAGGYCSGPLFAPVRKRRAPKRDPKCTKTPGRLRRAAERRATPAWADRRAMAAAFKLARALSAETGITHSVDHIVPLQHPLVCGLHCPANLRVIPLVDNVRKANLTWPAMPGEQALLPIVTI